MQFITKRILDTDRKTKLAKTNNIIILQFNKISVKLLTKSVS